MTIKHELCELKNGGTSTYPATWYAATEDTRQVRPALTSRIETDVCVIGGGLAGLSLACELAERHINVVLLEARRVASGASGLNGGFVVPGFAASVSELGGKISLAATQALHRLSMEGAEIVRSRALNLSPKIIMGEGLILALRRRDQGSFRRYGEELNDKFGRNVRHLATEELRARLKSEVYFEGLEDARGFHIHPLRYALALARVAEQAGAKVHEDSRAIAVSRSGGAFVVRTGAGEVRARQVVHCHSAHDRRLFRQLGRAVLPVATYVGVTEPLGQRVREAINTGAAVADNRRAGDYYRVIDEGRILWGGRITTRVSEPGRLAQMLKADMLGVYPQLGNPDMHYSWSGLMGYAVHKMPILGELAPGQWASAAFGGHGLNTTAMAGRLLGARDRRRRSGMAPFSGIGGAVDRWTLRARRRATQLLEDAAQGPGRRDAEVAAS